MILPKVRDLRLVTIRRGGSLTDADHRILAIWAAQCAEHVLKFFEYSRPSDARPREAIEAARAWARDDMTMMWRTGDGGGPSCFRGTAVRGLCRWSSCVCRPRARA